MTVLGSSESTARIASYCRAEQLVFALAGDGATRFASSESAPTLLAVAAHAAWRATRWYELLPTAPPGPDTFLVPTEADREVAAVARERIVDVVTLLAVLSVELLPRVRRAMEEHLDRTTPVADAEVQRILGIARTDLATDLLALRDSLERSSPTPEDRDRADAVVGAVAAVAGRPGWPEPRR